MWRHMKDGRRCEPRPNILRTYFVYLQIHAFNNIVVLWTHFVLSFCRFRQTVCIYERSVEHSQITIYAFLMFVWPCIISTTMYSTNKMQQLFRLLIFLNQPCMFRATNSPILRSTFWLYIQLLVQCTVTIKYNLKYFDIWAVAHKSKYF